MGVGIDYGRGLTVNRDPVTGIRYGILPPRLVPDSWFDESEPDYGDPTCPRCGRKVKSTADESPAWARYDYFCGPCHKSYWSDNVYGDVNVQVFKDEEYKCFSDEQGDVWVTKSPYFTRAAFCSPCAPGACYLASPDDDGERAFCLGHEWFEDGKAPYPVYSVATGERVLSQKETS